MKTFKHLGLIGCGMMGGSFALAAKKAGLVDRVVGYSKSPSNSERAVQIGAIDAAAPSILQAVMGADLILVSVPVSATLEVFKSLQYGLSPEALLMDVGSTKQNVVDSAEKIFGKVPVNFVPAHPIAGKERSSIEEADRNLYKGHRVILTPIVQTGESFLRDAESVWQALGMTVNRMTPEAHDATYAAVSHLPHLLAFAYMNGLLKQSGGSDLLNMGGSGFKDFTRIAGGDPEMWADIFVANRKEILKQAGSLLLSLSQFEYAMREGDPAQLKELITTASTARNAWRQPSVTSIQSFDV